MERLSISIGLLHFPVYNKKKEVVTTSITTSCLHDISRTARTFGVDNFYIITPLQSQRELVGRLIKHWQEGYGAQYNPTRRYALQNVAVVSNLGDCLQGLREKYGHEPATIVTSARAHKKSISYAELRKRIRLAQQPYIIIFGTGWGIEESLIDHMDIAHEPVYGQGNYNHLSVRAAVAIILDRLMNKNR
ncbi:MAG: RNA methyltransferase [Methanomassiliicoccales archaeon]|nr:MAG: RNA methyltransferase [Methanomassiliicoccales archaeon]